MAYHESTILAWEHGERVAYNRTFFSLFKNSNLLELMLNKAPGELGGMKFHEIIAHPLFQIFGIPAIFLLIGVFAKQLGRRDGDVSPHRNDWAVATTVLLMTLGVIAADLRTTTTSTTDLTAWLVGVLLFTLISIHHDRYRSWERAAGAVTDKKKMFIGIVLPDLFAILVFSAYQYDKLRGR